MAFGKVSMKKIILFFILILFLIGNAPLAKAECGWVLWLKNEIYFFTNEPKERISWDIVFAFPKFNQCQEGRTGMYRQTKKSKLDQRKNDKTMEVETDDSKQTIKTTHKKFDDGGITALEYIYYICLPDTVDPRKK